MRRRDRIYQIKVTLRGIRPAIWRRILVPGFYSFWDLHVAIQDSMGWLDSHLHQFKVVPAPRRRSMLIGIPDDDGFVGDPVIHPGWTIPITKYLSAERPRADYLYDFGDDWEHSILVEQICDRMPHMRYPACVDGRRRCPPEDVGGISGYEEFLEALADPEHEEHESYLTWVGGTYDPDAFDPEAIRFMDPWKRWRVAFLDEELEEEDLERLRGDG